MGNMCAEGIIEKENNISSINGKNENKPIDLKIFGKVVDEINTMRRNPGVYAQKVNNMYTSKIRNGIHEEYKIEYNEGDEAFKELEVQLMKTPRLQNIVLEDGMIAACYLYASHISSLNIQSILSTNREDVIARYNKHGSISIDKVKECTQVLSTKDASRIVIEMLVDDGIVSRQNRNTLMSDDYRCMGVSIVKDKNRSDYHIVMGFAQSYKTKDQTNVRDIVLKAEQEAEM